ncbi:MAG TPA: type III pantothenate kinase [Candidatus Limnocylindrales bacterium]|nr:type III pantothenate kinase [Candidatus Limnocylindrales bacterium]
MLVAIDVGNSNIKYSFVHDGAVVSIGTTPTPQSAATTAVDDWVAGLPGEGGVEGQTLDIAVVSVVPSVTEAIREAAASRGISVLVADESTIPIEIRVENPAAVGDDRLINAYAALRFHGAPAIVVDMGTATTFDVVDAEGAFVGGAIAAGAGLGIDALARGTAQLPSVPLVMPATAIGRDTISAMQSGAVIGHSGLVLVLIRAITDQLTSAGGPSPKVILTGGLSTAEWAQAIPKVDVIDPYLTLEGLARLHQEVGHPAPVGQA